MSSHPEKINPQSISPEMRKADELRGLARVAGPGHPHYEAWFEQRAKEYESGKRKVGDKNEFR